MPHYSWEARSAGGASVRGELEAPSQEAALQSLRAQRLTVTRIEERAAGVEDYTAVPPAPGTTPNRRPRESFRDRFFHVGVVVASAAISVGVAFISPVHVYECARQPSGAVDCTVHRRVAGLLPVGDLRVTRIQSVEVKTGVHSETTSERRRRLEFGRDESSYERLELVCQDGTRWRSPESSWPLGRPLSEVRAGIQQLLDARSPESYRAWTADKVSLTVALAFLAPAGFILLGLVLRLVVPRSFVEERLVPLAAAARRRRQARMSGR
jgi:hypothetical protein